MYRSWRKSVSVLLAMELTGVLGQTTPAVCLPYFDWLDNSQHQSPCVVASTLLSVCNGGSFTVDALPDSTHYLGPVSVFSANDCQCNTVTYSLMSACAACQGRSYISWSEWTANCPHVSSGFPEPLPTGLHVPGWAYLDPRPSDNFDQIQAQRNVNLTESVVLPSPTTTSNSAKSTSNKRPNPASSPHPSTSTLNHGSSVVPETSTNPSPTSASDTISDNSSSNHHANMIGGITVGVTFVVLGLIAASIWFFHSHIKGRETMVRGEPMEENRPTVLERGH